MVNQLHGMTVNFSVMNQLSMTLIIRLFLEMLAADSCIVDNGMVEVTIIIESW